MTILDALRDRQLLGGLATFKDLATWKPWISFVSALLGLPMDAEDLDTFRKCTGREQPRPGGYSEAVCLVGRQSGKSRICATLAAWTAATATPEPGGGEKYALMLSQDARASQRVLLSYASACFDQVPLLRRMVTGRTADTISLENQIRLAAYPARAESPRGLRSEIVLCDELAHYISSDGRPLDRMMLRAARWTLATTGGRLIILTSPRGQTGAVYDLWKAHHARNDSETLVWQTDSRTMNPTLDPAFILRQERDDPEGHEAEFHGRFLAGLSNLFDPDALDACVVAGRRELAPVAGVKYSAFADPAGGSGSDSYAVAVGHRDADRIVIDALRAWAPKFNPSSVTAEAAALLRSYRIDRITGDRFAGEWVREPLRAFGITYDLAEMNKSEMYLAMLPAVNAGLVEILDLPDLLRQLRLLERRRGSARDRVDHPRGSHDDAANVCAGLVCTLGAGASPISGSYSLMLARMAEREKEKQDKAAASLAGLTLEKYREQQDQASATAAPNAREGKEAV